MVSSSRVRVAVRFGSLSIPIDTRLYTSIFCEKEQSDAFDTLSVSVNSVQQMRNNALMQAIISEAAKRKIYILVTGLWWVLAILRYVYCFSSLFWYFVVGYLYGVVVKSSRSLSPLLMSFLSQFRQSVRLDMKLNRCLQACFLRSKCTKRSYFCWALPRNCLRSLQCFPDTPAEFGDRFLGENERKGRRGKGRKRGRQRRTGKERNTYGYL